MTTDEIRALVAQKIAGQGSAVDVGSGLPTILNAICDALDTTPAPQPAIVIEGTQNTDDNTFIPTDPAYTYEVVKDLILSGRIVLVKYYNDMAGIDEWDAFVQITELGILFGQTGIVFPV